MRQHQIQVAGLRLIPAQDGRRAVVLTYTTTAG